MSGPRVCVGAIGGAYGVRGEVRVKSFCALPADIETYNPLTREDGTGAFTLAIVHPIKTGFSVRIAEVATKEQADALKGTLLYAPRERLPSLPDDEFYHADLEGLLVVDTGGAELGRVRSVQNHGASDLLEVIAPGASATVLLPFTKAVVPTVDLAAGRIVADPPEGLF
ncbi:MAG: ribosome maturation factor RimM [Pseudomonadota bacterium]